MTLNQPKVVTCWIAVILGVLGILANFVTIPILSGIAFWLVVVGLALLAVATLIKGL